MLDVGLSIILFAEKMPTCSTLFSKLIETELKYKCFMKQS